MKTPSDLDRGSHYPWDDFSDEQIFVKKGRDKVPGSEEVMRADTR